MTQMWDTDGHRVSFGSWQFRCHEAGVPKGSMDSTAPGVPFNRPQLHQRLQRPEVQRWKWPPWPTAPTRNDRKPSVGMAAIGRQASRAFETPKSFGFEIFCLHKEREIEREKWKRTK